MWIKEDTFKKQTEKTFNIILKYLQNTSEQLSPQAIGNLGYGLQNLDSSVVSKEFINALTKHLEKVRDIQSTRNR